MDEQASAQAAGLSVDSGEWAARGDQALEEIRSGNTTALTIDDWAAAYHVFNSRRWSRPVALGPRVTQPSGFPTLQWALEHHVDEGSRLGEALVLEERAIERFRAYVLVVSTDAAIGPKDSLDAIKSVEVLSGWDAATESFDPFGWHQRCSSIEPLGASFEVSAFVDQNPHLVDGPALDA